MLRTKKILIKQEMESKTTQDSYLPTINAPATKMSTVNEILNQAMKIAGKLDIKEVCLFDQALHA